MVIQELRNRFVYQSPFPQPAFNRDDIPIEPDPNRPVFAHPVDVRTGRLPSGFKDGKPADALAIFVVGGVSGGGPSTQILQSAENGKDIAQKLGVPFYCIGPKEGASSHQGTYDFASADFTGSLPPYIGELPKPTGTYAQQYEALKEAMVEPMQNLAATGAKRLLLFANGYTAFGPYAVKHAVAFINEKLIGEGKEPLKVIFVNHDSAFNNADAPEIGLDEQGRPTGRFYAPAYASDEFTRVVLQMNNWPPYDVEDSANRAPAGAICMAVSLPYTERFVEQWAAWRHTDQITARRKVVQMIQEINPHLAQALQDPNVYFIPLFANGEYFRPETTFMTARYSEEVRQGSFALVDALAQVSQQTGRRIVLSGTADFAGIAHAFGVPNVHPIEEWSSTKSDTGLFIAVSPRFLQKDYGNFYVAAREDGLGVGRSDQANAEGDLVATGVPFIDIVMPRFMDSQLVCDAARRRGLPRFPAEVDPSLLATEIRNILTRPEVGRRLVDTADRMYWENFGDPGSNFGTVMAHLAGIDMSTRAQE